MDSSAIACGLALAGNIPDGGRAATEKERLIAIPRAIRNRGILVLREDSFMKGTPFNAGVAVVCCESLQAVLPDVGWLFPPDPDC